MTLLTEYKKSYIFRDQMKHLLLYLFIYCWGWNYLSSDKQRQYVTHLSTSVCSVVLTFK